MWQISLMLTNLLFFNVFDHIPNDCYEMCRSGLPIEFPFNMTLSKRSPRAEIYTKQRARSWEILKIAQTWRVIRFMVIQKREQEFLWTKPDSLAFQCFLHVYYQLSISTNWTLSRFHQVILLQFLVLNVLYSCVKVETCNTLSWGVSLSYPKIHFASTSRDFLLDKC